MVPIIYIDDLKQTIARHIDYEIVYIYIILTIIHLHLSYIYIYIVVIWLIYGVVTFLRYSHHVLRFIFRLMCVCWSCMFMILLITIDLLNIFFDIECPYDFSGCHNWCIWHYTISQWTNYFNTILIRRTDWLVLRLLIPSYWLRSICDKPHWPGNTTLTW